MSRSTQIRVGHPATYHRNLAVGANSRYRRALGIAGPARRLTSGDYVRALELCRAYIDSDIGFVDAAVLAVVEGLNEPKLATLDHRHFGMLRPRHVAALTLVPEL